MDLDAADSLTTSELRFADTTPQRVVAREDPTTLTFSTKNGKGVLESVAVTLTNAGNSGVTESITVTRELTLGGQVHDSESATDSITLPAEGTRTLTIGGLSGPLTPGYHRLRVSTPSDATVGVTQTAAELRPESMGLTKRRDGTIAFEDTDGHARFTVRPGESGVRFPGGVADAQGHAIRDFGGSGLAVADGTLQTTTQTHAESVTVSGDGTTTVTLPHSLGAVPSQVGPPTPTSPDAAGTFHVSGRTETDITLTYETARTDGTDNLSYDLLLVA